MNRRRSTVAATGAARASGDETPVARPVLDDKDLEILGHLQSDGKLTNVELAARVDLSPSPCLARVRELETAGVIDRYVALLDAEALGFGVTVFVDVTLEKLTRKVTDAFESAVVAHREVMECYRTSGDADYRLRVIAADVAAFDRYVLDRLAVVPAVARIRSCFAMKQVKFETAYPLRGIPVGVDKARRSR